MNRDVRGYFFQSIGGYVFWLSVAGIGVFLCLMGLHARRTAQIELKR
jgi:hypothetical protein